MYLFRESFLNSPNPAILSTGNSRISNTSLFVECRLPYSRGGYSPALVLNDQNTGMYEVNVADSKSGERKTMGFLKRKGDGTNRLFIENCSLNLNKFDKIFITLNGVDVLYGTYKYPSGWY
jgi:hypothetical protein